VLYITNADFTVDVIGVAAHLAARKDHVKHHLKKNQEGKKQITLMTEVCAELVKNTYNSKHQPVLQVKTLMSLENQNWIHQNLYRGSRAV
jgi:hypothetical protein